jgi:beta-aspartyl-peptidase (threonine type)
VGEEFIRRAAAHDVAVRVAYKGVSLQEAMQQVVWESFSEGDGGFVGVDSDYNIVWDFNRCVCVGWAHCDSACGNAGMSARAVAAFLCSAACC